MFNHDHEYADTAETTSNLGRIETRENEIFMIESIRSQIGAKKQYLKDKVTSICKLLDVDWNVTGGNPGVAGKN